MEGNLKILLVDDDPLVLKMYQDSLTRQGLKVDTANEGLTAVQTLRTARPQVLVLDLMMPRFSGVDVLKFIRSDKALADLPVVILSNSYMNDMANAAVDLGVQAALMKVRCTPRELAETIRDVAYNHSRRLASPDLEATSKPEPPPPTSPPVTISQPAASSTQTGAVPPPPPLLTPAPVAVAATTAEFMVRARTDFLATGPATIASLRGLSQAFNAATTPNERTQRIETFYRKVHFLSATAGLAECHQIAWLASGFEAMLFELIEKPTLAGLSVLRTIASTLDFLGELYVRAANPAKDPLSPPPPAHALVVDDDPVSNRVIVAALRRAEVHARSTQDPKSVVAMLEQKKSDLILLDIEMPGMDGFEVCKRIRALPNYAKTPVIYVTGHDDFENRAKGVLSGGTDLISKPVFPIELAVKAVTQMLKSQMD